jgi:predicted RNase H-like HicB family nuclease
MPMKTYLIGKTIEEAVTSLREATELYVEEQLDTELQWPGVSVRERPGVS